MRKIELILILLISIMVLAILLIVFVGDVNLSPSEDINSDYCRSLSYNGENSFNLVFFSDKDTANDYSQYLLSTEPFSDNKDKFNVFYIRSEDFTPDCELYRDKAILCYSRDLERKASSCSNADYLVVTKDVPSEIRSSAYLNTISINLNHNKNVLLHEFGHIFANLADEYLTGSSPPEGSGNCALACDKFPGEIDSCHQECSDSEHYRSIMTSVMRSLSTNEFGKLNKMLINRQVDNVLGSGFGSTGFAISEEIGLDCADEKYLLIEGSMTGNELSVNDKAIVRGCRGRSLTGTYSYNLILSDFSVYESGRFTPETIFIDPPNLGEGGGGSEPYEGNFYLELPLLDNAQELEILDSSDEVVDSIDLTDVGARPCR